MKKATEKRLACAIISDKDFNDSRAYMLGKFALAIDGEFKSGDVSGKALLDTIGSELSPTQRDILLLRYNLGSQHMNKLQTYNSIGNSFGLSGERVRQIVAEALLRLRQPANIVKFSLRERDIINRTRLETKDKSLGVEYLDLERRVYRSIHRVGIDTIEDLANTDLARIRNIGAKGIDEIRRKLDYFFES